MHTRRAATFVFAAVAAAALTVGCSPSQEPADPSSITTTDAPAAAAPAAGGDDDATTAAPITAENNGVVSVEVSGGEVSPPPGPVDVAVGSTIVIEVTSDKDDVLYVQGYNRAMNLAAGEPGRLVLLANTPGEFQVELLSGPVPLFTLRVS